MRKERADPGQKNMPKPFVVALVATDTEYEAAHNLSTGKHLEYAQFGYKRSLVLESQRLFLVIQHLGRMGNVDAALGAAEAIRHYRPICVVGAGICAGVSTKKSEKNYCDLVVANRVVYYEPTKEMPTGREWRPRALECPVSANLRGKVRKPDGKVFQGLCPKGEDRPIPKVHHGLYASGESVIADEKLVLRLRLDTYAEYGKDIAAIDMEAAGIAEACAPTQTKFLIVKAISDLADENKTDDWQKCAATISLEAVIDWTKRLTDNEIDELRKRKGPEDKSKSSFYFVSKVTELAGHMLPCRGVSLDQITKKEDATPLRTFYDDLNTKFITGLVSDKSHHFIADDKRKSGKSFTTPLTDKKTWIVDAVDGAQNLAEGRPEVAVSVALYENKEPHFAIIRLPYRGMTITKSKSHELQVNEVPWTRRRPGASKLSEAVVALPGDMQRLKDNGKMLSILSAIASRARWIRVTGSLAYDLACLALGEFDARISTSVERNDAAAGAFLVRGMHGKVTDFDGDEWIPGKTNLIAAATPDLHAEILCLIKNTLAGGQAAG